MPSTISSSVSRLFASSTVMTPSLPTFCIAFAIISPIDLSPLAEIVPTWLISSLEVTFFEFFLRSATTALTARSTPRFRSIGLRPGATAFPSQLFKRRNSVGANFQTMTLPGTTSRDEVTKTFRKVQDRDRSQNDSQYSGGFGMCSGLILTDYNFHIRRTAEAY